MPTSGPVSPSDGHPEAGGGGCASSNPTLDNDRLQGDDGGSDSYGKSQDSNAEKPGDYLTRSQVIAALALYGKYHQESEEDKDNVEKYHLAYRSTAHVISILQHYHKVDEVIRGLIDLFIHRWGMALDPRVDPPHPDVDKEVIFDETGSMEAWLDAVFAEDESAGPLGGKRDLHASGDAC